MVCEPDRGGGDFLFHRHVQRTDVYQCVEFGADPNPKILVNFKVVSRSVLVLGGGLSSLSDSERSVTNFNCV